MERLIMPTFLRRAQMTTKKRFVENLFNLKDSISNILRGDAQYLVDDIKKLRNDARRLNRSDPAFEQLNIVDTLTKFLDVSNEDIPNDINKYKRLNNFYNNYIVKPVRDNIGLFGLQIDPAQFINKDVGVDTTAPQSLKLDPQVPSYLKLKNVPNVSDDPKSSSWHNKLNDVSEMLKVLGGYIPEFEDWLRSYKLIQKDTTQIINLESRVDVNSKINNSREFYTLATQIAYRMKTANLIAVKSLDIIYTLEELPKEHFLSPSSNREVIENLWYSYLKSGKDQHIIKRAVQLGEEQRLLKKKFHQVYKQWSVLYEDTAKQLGVTDLEPIRLQLVRYGQQIISGDSILEQMRELNADLEVHIENLRDFATDLYGIYLTIKSNAKKVAQLRTPSEVVTKELDIPMEPVKEMPDTTKPVKPPKLPVGDEWLSLVFEEDKDLYYSKNEELTPPQAIALAGRNGLKVMMQYQKASGTGDVDENAIKNYVLEPYSYRIKKTDKRGQRKYLFGYDTVDGTIKSFLVGGIRGVEILADPFMPRWEIEFH